MAGVSRNVGSFWRRSRDTTRICRVLPLAVAGVGFLYGGAIGSAIATSRSAPAELTETVVFDIPAQALPSAIEAYSIAAGWQVIYDASLATGRRSAAVKGELAPAVALRLLLAGTGLMPQFMTADGIMLVPAPAVVGPAAAAEPTVHVRDYYGRIQGALKRVFCADEDIRSGAYRIAIGLWIGPSGMVTRVAALGSTGRAEIDAVFDQAVRKVAVGQPPPPGFDQPVVILVTPELLGQCHAAGPRPARAAR